MTDPEVALYDSITLSNIPVSARAVAGYVDGRWRTWDAVLQRWPRARHISITVTGASEADAADVETGDLTPQGGIAWLRRMHALGHPAPALYADLDTWATQLQPLLSREFERSQYRVWTAHYTHRWHRCSPTCDPRLVIPVDATQFTDVALNRDLDASAASTRLFVRHAQP